MGVGIRLCNGRRIEPDNQSGLLGETELGSAFREDGPFAQTRAEAILGGRRNMTLRLARTVVGAALLGWILATMLAARALGALRRRRGARTGFGHTYKRAKQHPGNRHDGMRYAKHELTIVRTITVILRLSIPKVNP